MSDLARLVIAVDSGDARAAKRDLDALAGSGDKLMGVMRGLASAIGVSALAKQLFDVNKEFQQLQAQLVTVTGSAEAADSAFRFLEQFAQDTPFQLNEVTQAFTRLKATGLDATAEALTNWGNLASANSKNILDTIQAVTAASFGETETMKQYGIIIRNLGDSVAITFKGATTQVKNSSSAIYAELQKLAAANFAGGMKRQMDTLGGVASNLVDTWQSLLRAVGNTGAGSGIIAGIRALTDWLDKAKRSLLELATLPAWWEFIDSINLAARQVFGLATQILNLGAAVGEAGVQSGFFARIWQGIALLVAGVRDTVTLMTNAWRQAMADLYSGLTVAVSGYRMLIDAMPDSVKKKLGIDPETIYQVAMLEIKLGDLAVAADKVATETAATATSAYEEVMQGIEESSALAIQRAEEIKKMLGAAPGTLPAGGGNPDQASAQELMRRAQFLKALKEEASTLGLTAEETKYYAAQQLHLEKNTFVLEYLNRMRNYREMLDEIKFAEDQRIEAERESTKIATDRINRMFDLKNTIDSTTQAEMDRARGVKDLNDMLRLEMITEQEHARGMDILNRKYQDMVPVWTEMFGNLKDTIQDWSRSSTEAFLDLAFKGKAAFSDLITSMLRDLARLAVQRNVMQPLFSYLGNAINSYGGDTGPTTTANTTGFIDNAPVSSIQSGGAKVATNINVTVNTGKGEVDTQGQSGTELGRKLDAAVKAVMLNEMRPGGLLAARA